MILHFAYGSNMSRAMMRLHAHSAVAVGPARLDNHRFIVTADGYASIVPAPGQAVHGVLWRLTARDVAALNAFEGIAKGFYRSARLRVSAAGRRETALVYVSRTRAEGRPRSGYLDVVIGAALDWDLPATYVRSIERCLPSGWHGARQPDIGELG